MTQKFFVDLIRVSRYDDDGYLVQWRKTFIPSSSLACLHSLISAIDAKTFGPGVELIVHAYDEYHTVVPTRQIIRRIRRRDSRGVVLLVGVQTSQFPRAADLARELRAAGIQVAIGGFHVSGCLAMLPQLPADMQALQALGVCLFAGEAEGRIEGLLADAYNTRLRSVYDYLAEPPEIVGHPLPNLPGEVARRTLQLTAFDAGRGCPFRCSFCTVINIQGRKSRVRDAADVERLVRDHARRGVWRFFITDDNLARNRNWEQIFDRLILLREREGFRLEIGIQVDVLCHRIPGFIEKASRAGCSRIFVGLESMNAANLADAGKRQNRLEECRRALQAWRAHGALTYAGYIIGFSNDTPGSIEQDIRLLQRELPVDILELFVLTPLPGSADHRALALGGAWLEPDLSLYDAEHVTTEHPLMSAHAWQETYDRAWDLYYSPQHVETLMRRARASGLSTKRVQSAVLAYYGCHRFEGLHALQGGIGRRKVRATRRPGFPRERLLPFLARRLRENAVTWYGYLRFWLSLERIRRRVLNEPRCAEHLDRAVTPHAATSKGRGL